jgi:S1-C subfamily serine protease
MTLRAPLAALVALAVAAATGCGATTTARRSVDATAVSATAGTTTDAATALQSAFVRVVRTEGDIVTNAHVVGSAKRFSVTLANGDRRSATLVGTFAPNDLAVIHVSGTPPPPATFGDSAKLAVGDIVFALGNPLGLRSSVTQGIVSSLRRTVGEGNGVALGSVIQTSAPINPGNSGGALVDLQSQVIGIPTLAALDPEFGSTPASGIGFAIPSDTVKLIADQLIRSGRVTVSGRAYLGVTIATPITGGVVVVSVVHGGPAARAGIRPGDAIVAAGKQPVASIDDLATALAAVKPGATIPITVERDGNRRTLHVKLGELKSP